MQFGLFDERRNLLYNEYKDIEWINGSGLDAQELEVQVNDLAKKSTGEPHNVTRARMTELILTSARISVEDFGIFCEKVDGRRIMARYTWENTMRIAGEKMPEETRINNMGSTYSCFSANHDFGHIALNSKRLLGFGLSGLLDRVHNAVEGKELSERQKNFVLSCEITIGAYTKYFRRLSEAVKGINPELSECLYHISTQPPRNTYEALQLLIGYFYAHEYIGAARDRTLGRLDDSLYLFYKNDIESGRYTKEQIKELYKYFLMKLWAMRVPFDLPLEIGGMKPDGEELTNELSYLIAEAYNEIEVHSPKIHVRVSDKTPESFIKNILSYIRGGNSSFVFCNDNVAIKALMSVGISEKEARDYVLIGCYEPSAWEEEVPCTGNSHINLAKATELALNCGRDMKTGELVGCETPFPESFDEVLNAVKKQIGFFTESVMRYVNSIEAMYPKLYSDPMMSCMMDSCLERVLDAYEGSARYNNSSVNIMGIATLVDCLCAVKKVVYEEKKVSLCELCEILKNNWRDNEKLRLYCSNIKEKYGNGNATADDMAKNMASFCASVVNGKPNGRGGVYKAGLFSIDHCFTQGKNTWATPDGRFAGQPFSKNLCATTAKDRNGITSLINSVTEMDLSQFPNGSVLDVIMHPSAVSGEDGLCAMYGLLMSYFKRGGFAMHGNVFDANELRKAQQDPEKYATLQVRVCGWNVYFVNLSKEEQDEFIKQTESIA